MIENFEQLHNVWKTNKALDSTRINLTFDDLTNSIMSTGPFSFYVIDFFDMSLSHISPSNFDMFDFDPETLTFNAVLATIHPDDVELGCSGTIAKEISLGKKVGIIDLTRGELGTRGSVEIRNQEAAAAAKILGVSVRENLDMRDGFFVNDEAHQLKIIKMIRKYQPEIVICNAIEDRHIDHGKGSQLVSDACFLSGLMKIETEINGENQKAWRPKLVYHYMQWKNLTPDFVVDITGFNDKRVASILAYGSQFYNSNSEEPETPIASKNFLESLNYRPKDLGRLIGTDYAEGFTVERYLAVNSLSDLM